MKKITFALLLLFSLYSSAQDILGEWFLYSITTNGNTQVNDSFYGFNIVFFENETTGELNFQGLAVCNSYSCENVSILSANTITTENINVTLAICNTPEENSFEGSYFNIFQYGFFTTFQFEINGADNLGTGIIETLTFTNEDGDILIYGRQALQESNTLAGEWFLYDITNNQTVVNNFPQPISVIFSDEFQPGENNIIINGICNTYNSSYLTPIYENSFLCQYPEWNPSECTDDVNDMDLYLYNLFDNHFDDFFQVISYEITGSENEEILEISQIFYQGDGFVEIHIGHFGRLQLSTPFENLKSDIYIYPNPVKTVLNVSFRDRSSNNYTTYSIITLDGKSIKKQPLVENKINVSFLSEGLYFLRLENRNRIKTIKFLKFQ